MGTLVVLLFGAMFAEGFVASASLRNMALLATLLMVVAASQTLPILLGGVDLSIPWVMTGAALLVSYRGGPSGSSVFGAVVLALVFSAVAGLFSGVGIAYWRVPPIVMTLATNVILSGLVIIYGLRQTSQGAAPPIIRTLVVGSYGPIPGYVVIMVVLTAVMTAVLTFTRYGRRLYAVGTSVEAAGYSGVRVQRVIVATYVLSAVVAGTGGMLLLGYVNSGYFGMGDSYLFTSISAVVVGGVSILGGSGHVVGAIGGALLLTVANGLLVVLSVGPGALSIFYGVIILGSAVILSPPVRLRMTRSQMVDVTRPTTLGVTDK